jgi:hypothetical protein
MKRFIFLLIISINSNISFSQLAKLSETTVNEYKEAEKRKFNRVKKITTKEFQDSLSYLNNFDYKILNIEEYDLNGDLSKFYCFSDDGEIYLCTVYKHDEKHRMISYTDYLFNGQICGHFEAIFEDSFLTVEKRYSQTDYCDSIFCTYNKKGNPKSQIMFQNGFPKDIQIWINDNKGNPKISKSYSLKVLGNLSFGELWQLEHYIEYEYLSNMDYVERIYESDSTLRMKRYNKFDNHNNITDVIEFVGEEELITWYSYDYDEYGNEIKSAVYNSLDKKLDFKTENKYENGLLKEVYDYDKENKLVGIIRNYYNENGINILHVYNELENGKYRVGNIHLMEVDYEK